MADTQWYYSKNDEKIGPISLAQLREQASSGAIHSSDHVWCKGMEAWKPLIEVFPELGIPETKPHIALEKFPDTVSQKFWFLDLKFESFATPKLIGFVFALWLVVSVLMFASIIFYVILILPVIQAVLVIIAAAIQILLTAVLVRVFLELFLVIFKIAEHLKNLRYLPQLDHLRAIAVAKQSKA